jgi:hypothetical protein
MVFGRVGYLLGFADKCAQAIAEEQPARLMADYNSAFSVIRDRVYASNFTQGVANAANYFFTFRAMAPVSSMSIAAGSTYCFSGSGATLPIVANQPFRRWV